MSLNRIVDSRQRKQKAREARAVRDLLEKASLALGRQGVTLKQFVEAEALPTSQIAELLVASVAPLGQESEVLMTLDADSIAEVIVKVRSRAYAKARDLLESLDAETRAAVDLRFPKRYPTPG